MPVVIWFILGLLMGLLVLNYFDRQTLSILKPLVKTALGFDDQSYSLLTFAFMLPYIVMYVASGRLIDRFGTRICMTVFAMVWSAANIASGLSSSFSHLVTSRVFLGAAEPGVFPAIQRAILNWVPVERRTLAISIVSPAGNLGAVLAPPLVALLTVNIGWRGAFVIPGLIGITIAVLWWFTDTRKTPQEHQGGSTALPGPVVVRNKAMSANSLLGDKRFLAIIAVRVISDPVFYFYLFWTPGYLQERVGLSLSKLGMIGGIPYIVAMIGCVVMGRTVDRYAARGHDPIRVQLWLFAITAGLMPFGAFITKTSSPAFAIAIITVVITVCQAWFVGFNVLLAGLFPVNVNASAVGMLGAVGATSSLFLNLIAGSIVMKFDYVPIFVGLALLHPISSIILAMVIGQTRPKRLDPMAA